MSSRYDSRTTTFSPEGRLYQVEYAMEAISEAGAALGITGKDGIVLVAEKRITSQLLDLRQTAEKMYKIDDHIVAAVAGITADANILINFARLEAQRYFYTYQEPIPVEQLLRRVCDIKQGYTQSGGKRPFGVSFLFAGWDDNHGFQLYKSDPSGNYGGWKATAIGANNQNAKSTFKEKYDVDEPPTLEDSLELGLRVMAKSMDTTEPSPDKLEFATVTQVDGKVAYKIFTKDEIKSLLSKVDLTDESEAASGDI